MKKRLRLLFPFVIECKHYRTLQWNRALSPAGLQGTIRQWWRQGKRAAAKAHKQLPKIEYRGPLVVFKGNNGEIWAMSFTEGSYPGDRLPMPRIETFYKYKIRGIPTQDELTIIPFSVLLKKYRGE
jgi:hypothetical protein